MNCKVCGTTLGSNDERCPVCGTETGISANKVQSNTIQQSTVLSGKTETMALLDEAEQTAFQLDALYNRYITLADEFKKFRPQVTANRKGLIMFIVGWATIGLSFYGIILFGQRLLVLCILGIFAGIGLVIAGGIIKGKENRRIHAEIERQRKAYDEEVQKKRNSVLDEIPAVYERSSINGRFPLQYTNPDAVQRIRGYLQNMRADTLKEAINLLEQEYHNQKMMNAQIQMLESQLKTEYAARGAYNAAVASAISNAQTAYYARKTYETVYNK